MGDLPDDLKLRLAQNAVADALAKLGDELFAPQCRLTFIMRDPGNDECSMLVTNDDDLEGVERVLRARRLQEPSDG